MCPDILVKGLWLDIFLIYWATCYFGFFIICWITLGLRPWLYHREAYVNAVTNCLYLPLKVPVQFIYHWRHRNDPIRDAPMGIVEPDHIVVARLKAHENYMERLGEIEVAAAQERDQSGLGQGKKRPTDL